MIMERKAKSNEPPHKTHRPNNNVITISTLRNGNSKIIVVFPSACVQSVNALNAFDKVEAIGSILNVVMTIIVLVAQKIVSNAIITLILAGWESGHDVFTY